MNQLSRRQFLKTSSLGAAGLGISPMLSRWPSLLVKTNEELIFRPYPHPLMPAMPLVYATDENDDPFKSSMQTRQDGIVVPEGLDNRKFAVNARWYVEGFGYVWLGADNGGAYYSRDDFSNGRSFNLKKYVEKHTHDLVSHYGDKVLEWEVVNEYHDWANIHNHTPEQITEIVRLACDKTKETNPTVVRILNNCCPFADYVARGRMARMDATRPLRSPRQFIKDLIDANVEFDVLGIQIYFPQRDLSDIVRILERLAVFGKPIYITEIGASSNLPRVNPDAGGVAKEPYAWHRHWDEELQADWLEQVYTIYYSKPYVKAINWYDFSDFRPYIVNGGLAREDCSTKLSFQRLKNLLASWDRLPSN